MKRSTFMLATALTLLCVVQSAGMALAAPGAPGEACRGARRGAGGEMWPMRCNDPNAVCNPEMRGRCGKARMDFYGARKPVNNMGEAREQLLRYYEGETVTVSDIAENRWGFSATVLDKNGAVVDKVFIDKRSGRIRSLY